jgi:hypothetical protein
VVFTVGITNQQQANFRINRACCPHDIGVSMIHLCSYTATMHDEATVKRYLCFLNSGANM